MKTFGKYLLLSLALCGVLLACTSCASCAQGEIELEITEENMPQTVYPKGSRLNLEGGKLTVRSGGFTREIPLSSGEVTVKGYDRTKLGDQDVTVTYREKTVTFTVTVVERVRISNHVTSYRVGEELDLTKGRLTVTRDDGSSFLVVLSDAGISITGYDNTKEGEQTLTATYRSGEREYSVSYTVTVLPADLA